MNYCCAQPPGHGNGKGHGNPHAPISGIWILLVIAVIYIAVKKIRV